MQRHLLESVGLRLVRVTPMIDEAFYSVLEAEAV